MYASCSIISPSPFYLSIVCAPPCVPPISPVPFPSPSSLPPLMFSVSPFSLPPYLSLYSVSYSLSPTLFINLALCSSFSPPSHFPCSIPPFSNIPPILHSPVTLFPVLPYSLFFLFMLRWSPSGTFFSTLPSSPTLLLSLLF
jgi:hypothetical protein